MELNRIREMLGVMVIILMAFCSIFLVFTFLRPVTLVEKILEKGYLPSDSITRYEQQLSCLRDVLDPDEVVGFISSVESNQYSEYYLLTQYVLSPVIVDVSVTHDTVVGYFPDALDLEELQGNDLELLIDCGNGVLLLRQSSLP